MADTTKKADNAKKEKKVIVKLQRLPGANTNQDVYVYVNGRSFILKRGEEVEVPESVDEVLKNSALAEDYSIRYLEELEKSARARKSEDEV